MNEKILWAEKQFGPGIVIDDKHYISERTFIEKCKICDKEARARYAIVNGYGFYLCEECRETINTLSHDLEELRQMQNLIERLRGRETKMEREDRTEVG